MSVSHRERFVQGAHPIGGRAFAVALPLPPSGDQIEPSVPLRLLATPSAWAPQLSPPWCFHARRIFGEPILRESIGAG